MKIGLCTDTYFMSTEMDIFKTRYLIFEERQINGKVTVQIKKKF